MSVDKSTEKKENHIFFFEIFFWKWAQVLSHQFLIRFFLFFYFSYIDIFFYFFRFHFSILLPVLFPRIVSPLCLPGAVIPMQRVGVSVLRQRARALVENESEQFPVASAVPVAPQWGEQRGNTTGTTIGKNTSEQFLVAPLPSLASCCGLPGASQGLPRTPRGSQGLMPEVWRRGFGSCLRWKMSRPKK